MDHHADDSYTLKGLKQKLYVDGLCYLLQEIYGIENKNNEQYKVSKDCFKMGFFGDYDLVRFVPFIGPTHVVGR